MTAAPFRTYTVASTAPLILVMFVDVGGQGTGYARSHGPR